MGGFDFLDRDHEVSLLAGHVFTVVVLWEAQREGLAFARLHTAHCVFKFFQHLAFADQELEGFSFAAGEGFAFDLAFKINRHAVVVLRSDVHRALGKRATLLAQNVDGFVDGRIADFRADLGDFGTGEVCDFDVWVDFKNSVKQQVAFWRAFFFADARLTRHAQFSFIRSHRESLANLVVHDFVMN